MKIKTNTNLGSNAATAPLKTTDGRSKAPLEESALHPEAGADLRGIDDAGALGGAGNATDHHFDDGGGVLEGPTTPNGSMDSPGSLIGGGDSATGQSDFDGPMANANGIFRWMETPTTKNQQGHLVDRTSPDGWTMDHDTGQVYDPSGAPVYTGMTTVDVGEINMGDEPDGMTFTLEEAEDIDGMDFSLEEAEGGAPAGAATDGGTSSGDTSGTGSTGTTGGGTGTTGGSTEPDDEENPEGESGEGDESGGESEGDSGGGDSGGDSGGGDSGSDSGGGDSGGDSGGDETGETGEGADGGGGESGEGTESDGGAAGGTDPLAAIADFIGDEEAPVDEFTAEVDARVGQPEPGDEGSDSKEPEIEADTDPAVEYVETTTVQPDTIDLVGQPGADPIVTDDGALGKAFEWNDWTTNPEPELANVGTTASVSSDASAEGTETGNPPSPPPAEADAVMFDDEVGDALFDDDIGDGALVEVGADALGHLDDFDVIVD